MMHDTYYVVAHFEWVMFVSVASLCLVAIWTAIRKQTNHPRLNQWASRALRIWAIGLVLTVCATAAVRFLHIEWVGAPWAFQAISGALTIGMFLLCLAFAVMLATLCIGLWTWLRPTSD